MKFKSLIVVGLVLMLLKSCNTQPQPVSRKLIPIAIDLLTEPPSSSSVSSLSVEPPPDSDTSTESGGSYKCECRVCLCKDPNTPLSEEEFKRLQEDLRKHSIAGFDQQHTIVDLEVEVERLKAENDLLKTELQLAKQPAQQTQTFYVPAAPAACSNCGPQQVNSYQRRGIFGWRR